MKLSDAWNSDEAKGQGGPTRNALPCGREGVLALGMCSSCYTLRRQDEEYFGGLREAILERDGYRCRVCDAPGTGKRSIVHHRVPDRPELERMISFCPGCHAKVHRTRAVFNAMPPLLTLWREHLPKTVPGIKPDNRRHRIYVCCKRAHELGTPRRSR